jgi:hypothetical protein
MRHAVVAMKKTTLLSLAAVVSLTSLPALAQSKPVSVKHSAAVPRHLLLSAGHSFAGSVRLVSGVVAVPVWMSGGISTGVGASVKHSGKTANSLWDAVTGDPAKSPPLDRKIGLPKLKKSAGRPKDLSPAEALKQTNPN